MKGPSSEGPFLLMLFFSDYATYGVRAMTKAIPPK